MFLDQLHHFTDALGNRVETLDGGVALVGLDDRVGSNFRGLFDLASDLHDRADPRVKSRDFGTAMTSRATTTKGAFGSLPATVLAAVPHAILLPGGRYVSRPQSVACFAIRAAHQLSSCSVNNDTPAPTMEPNVTEPIRSSGGDRVTNLSAAITMTTDT
jgi:hypothetical protein